MYIEFQMISNKMTIWRSNRIIFNLDQVKRDRGAFVKSIGEWMWIINRNRKIGDWYRAAKVSKLQFALVLFCINIVESLWDRDANPAPGDLLSCRFHVQPKHTCLLFFKESWRSWLDGQWISMSRIVFFLLLYYVICSKFHEKYIFSPCRNKYKELKSKFNDLQMQKDTILEQVDSGVVENKVLRSQLMVCEWNQALECNICAYDKCDFSFRSCISCFLFTGKQSKWR